MFSTSISRYPIVVAPHDQRVLPTVPALGVAPVAETRRCAAWKGQLMHPDSTKYNESLEAGDQAICDLLAREIADALPEAENRVWHAHPVWFIEGNPIVGYSKLKNCVRLLFWSGQSFEAGGLKREGSFKAAEARYTSADQVDTEVLKQWLSEAREVQWDYRNIVRRKGKLERLK